MIAYPATISGANLILPSAIHLADRRVRAACGRGSSHAACRHVRACRPMGHDPEKWRPVFSEKIMLNYRSSDGSSLPTRRRSMGGCGVVTCGHRPIQKVSELKSPPPVSRRGLNSCDVEDMPVICPTAQAVFSATSSEAVMEPTAPKWPRNSAAARFKKSRVQEMSNLRGPRRFLRRGPNLSMLNICR